MRAEQVQEPEVRPGLMAATSVLQDRAVLIRGQGAAVVQGRLPLVALAALVRTA